MRQALHIPQPPGYELLRSYLLRLGSSVLVQQKRACGAQLHDLENLIVWKPHFSIMSIYEVWLKSSAFYMEFGVVGFI